MERLTLNRKRSILSSKNGGNVARTDTREIGVGVGGAGSGGSQAELPESGPLWPACQDSTHSSREQKESGLGWSQRQTWPNGTIRGPPDYAVIHRDHRSPEESRGFSSILISPVKKIRPETYSRAVTGDSQTTNRVSWLLPPSAVIKIYTISVLSLSPWLSFPHSSALKCITFSENSSVASPPSCQAGPIKLCNVPFTFLAAPHWTIWNSSFIYIII